MTAVSYAPGYPKILRKIIITATAGAAVVPHQFSTQPSTFLMGAMYAAPGPAAGVTNVYLDVSAPHTTGFDNTNLYLFVVGQGIFECYVG